MKKPVLLASSDYGYWVGINWSERVLSSSSKPTKLLVFMGERGIGGIGDVVGPFMFLKHARNVAAKLQYLINSNAYLPGVVPLEDICLEHNLFVRRTS